MNSLEAGERLPNAVRSVADVDHGEGVLLDHFEAAGPKDVAEARSHGCLDPRGIILGPHPLQPEQEQRDRDGGVVELKTAEQAHLKRAKMIIPEREIEPLP